MGARPNRAEVRHSWPTKRRDWRDHLNLSKRIVRSTESIVNLIARRSNDSGKPVWGSQVNMAAELGVSIRTVVRGLKELEQAGYLKVYRSKPERGPHGRFCRRKSNCYYLVIPGRQMAAQPAPRRRQRAPYCVVPGGDTRRHHLRDSDGTSSPDGVSQPHHHPPDEYQSKGSAHPKSRIHPLRALIDDAPGGVTTTEETYQPPEPASKSSVIAEMRQLRQKLKTRTQPQP